VISAELRDAIEQARGALRLAPELAMMNDIPAGSGRTIDGPDDISNLLQIADGPICGNIVIFDAKNVGKSQFYAEAQEGVPVRLGRDVWFCFGKVNEDPLFLHRENGTVWGFPDVGVIWWQSGRFEQFSESLDLFLLNYAFGADYQEFVGAGADDSWWQLLVSIGRV
jgi:hypothetical protein